MRRVGKRSSISAASADGRLPPLRAARRPFPHSNALPHASDAARGIGSVTYKIQREIIVVPLAWAPAILLQFAHPLVARGVADHSGFRSDRWGRMRRFRHTLDAMLRLCFGTDNETRRAADRINAIHDRVHGGLSETAGAFSAGTSYSAHDPALLAWVHATLLAMNLRVYELYVTSLSMEEKDRYCAEGSVMEDHLGIPKGYLPRSFRELQQYLDATLASGAITVTDTARTLARAILDPPLRVVASPLISLMRLTALGLLPAPIRDEYFFPWGRRDDAKLRVSAAFIRRVLPLTPPFLRYWPAARSAFAGRTAVYRPPALRHAPFEWIDPTVPDRRKRPE
jgi:uncharacterized protein (DUF2236 family)